MIRIYKTSENRTLFNKYSIDYLKEARDGEGGFWPKLSDKTSYYDGFRKDKTWEDILKQEQGNRCCYCMRRLDDGKISIEHLVPEQFTGLNEQKEYDYYVSNDSNLERYVILGSEFDSQKYYTDYDIESIVKFPHLIAYHNLYAACKGEDFGCCCNNHRGNRRILPLMVMSGLEDNLFYDNDGTFGLVFDDVEMNEKTISVLNINSQTLKEIRMLWRIMAKRSITYAQLKDYDELGRFELYELIETQLDNNDSFMKYFYSRGDHYWNLFLAYDWFYEYYSK